MCQHLFVSPGALVVKVARRAAVIPENPGWIATCPYSDQCEDKSASENAPQPPFLSTPSRDHSGPTQRIFPRRNTAPRIFAWPERSTLRGSGSLRFFDLQSRGFAPGLRG